MDSSHTSTSSIMNSHTPEIMGPNGQIIQTANAQVAQRRLIPIGLDWTQSSVNSSSYNEILRAMFPSLMLDSQNPEAAHATLNLLAAATRLRGDVNQTNSNSANQPLLITDRPHSQARRTRILQRPVAGANRRNQSNPSIHPQFRAKSVCKLYCKHCTTDLCMRGMKAILLGNTRVELFSTDTAPLGVQLVFQDYMTQNCACKIKDAACLGCGNVVGYHVTHPCESCLDACNNGKFELCLFLIFIGHFWMFHSDGVGSVDRITNGKILKWAELTGEVNEDQVETIQLSACDMMCR